MKLNSHESATGPNAAQYNSAIALLRTRSCRGAGRLRLRLSAAVEETFCNTHYFRPWKLLEMKLSFVPNEKKEVLFGAAISTRYWADPKIQPGNDVTASRYTTTSIVTPDTILHLIARCRDVSASECTFADLDPAGSSANGA